MGVDVEGLLYVDKPAGITSHDVVATVRRAARSKRVGHAGTLDPFATGLLVLAVGSCTRLLPYVTGEPKVYDAVIHFGSETDTDDGTGQVTVERAPPDLRDSARLDAALAGLTGEIEQQPPSYSAKHVDGKRAYELARKGAELSLPAVRVTVQRWDVTAVHDGRLAVRVTCGGGTYIRALARDLGRALGSASHCASLRRVASGPASVDDAVACDRLRPGSIAEGEVTLRPPLEALGDIARQELDARALRDVAHGRSIAATGDAATGDGALAALLHEGRVVGIARRAAGDRWQPKVVLVGDGAA